MCFLSPPFLSSSVKKLNLQVWGNSSDFTDCLLVSWGYDTLVLWESLSLRKIFKDKAEMSQAVLEWGQRQDVSLICRVQLKDRQQPPAPSWTIGRGLEDKFKSIQWTKTYRINAEQSEEVEKLLFHTWISSSLSGMAPYCLLMCSRIRLPRRWYHSWVCW